MLNLTNLFAKRLMSQCSSCNKTLILYKVSWRIVNLACILIPVGFVTTLSLKLDFFGFQMSFTQLFSLFTIALVAYILIGLKVKIAKI